MIGRMKIDPADKWFSLYIRMRDNWTCQRCGSYNPKGQQNSHYFGRTRESVRFDEENCDTLCHGCHRYWEKEDREAYRVFKITQLGEIGYQKLTQRANTTQTTDRKTERKMIQTYYAKRVKELEKTMM